MFNTLRRIKALAQGLLLSDGHEKNENVTAHETFKVIANVVRCEGDKSESCRPFHRAETVERVRKEDWKTGFLEDGEDPQTKALRIFQFQILYLACNMQASPESFLDRIDPEYKPSPDYDTVRACRLVSKAWHDEITAIFLYTGKPLMVINPMTQLQQTKRWQSAVQEPEIILDTIKSGLVRPDSLSPETCDLPLPPFRLHLPSALFYQEVENLFIHSTWPHFERYIYELHLCLPADSTMRFYWPEMHLENLRRIKIKCTNETQSAHKIGGLSQLHNPFANGNYMYLIQQILHGAKSAESFTLHCYAPHFAPGLFRMLLPCYTEFLDVPLVKMAQAEFTDCLENGRDVNCINLRHLIIRSPVRIYRREDEIDARYATFMLRKFASSVEQLELNVTGQEWDHIVWTMRRDYVYDPLQVEMTEPMRKLKSFSLHAGLWEVCGTVNYQVLLPQLRNLKLTMITRESQIKSLYQSKSTTVERLRLSFVNEMPYEVVKGFVDSLPFLREFDVTIKELNPGLHLCFQGFLRLRRLSVGYTFCNSEEGKELLVWAITGIPGEEQREIMNEEMTMLDAIKNFENCSSLRNLEELEELKLIVKSNSKLDVSIMLRTTFLQMPKLKKVKLSEKSIKIADEQKDYIRKENQHGLVLEWI